MGKRSEETQQRHDRAVALIARQRFDSVGWRTHVNPGDARRFGVPVDPAARGRTRTLMVLDPREAEPQVELVYPDIVCENVLTFRPTAIGEVETEETVTEEELAQWRAFAELGPTVHLYVPADAADRALALLAGAGRILVRAYRLTDGGIDIEPRQETSRGAQRASQRQRVIPGS
jgi:hypothetical protein